jgi:predicted component of type VI protein secretion system
MKAQLFILSGRDVGRSFDIGESAVLGRVAECEVTLHDRSISRKHARVHFTGERWIVEDLGSRNGMRFHDKRVAEIELKDHDEFVLGDLPIRFRLPAAAAPPVVAPVTAPVVVDAIQLEDEIELGAEVETVAPRREPVRLEPAPEEEKPEVSEYDRRRAQLLRGSQSTGMLRGDLSQRPFWVRALIGMLATVMALGISFLAYRIMQTLRGSS